MPEEEKIIPTCGAVVFDSLGNVLVVEHLAGASHLTGTFGLPAGKIEKGESTLDAVVREVREETGISIHRDRFKKLPTVYRATIEQKDGAKNMSWEVFAARIGRGELLSSSETAPRWVQPQELDTLNLLPNVRNAVQEARSIL